MGGARFELDGVIVEYPGIRALDGVDLEIGSGEAVALVGPSGSGKTTLLKTLGAVVRASAGRVLVDGEDLRLLHRGPLRAARSRIGFVHQDLSLIPNLRVVQNVVAGRLGRLSFSASLRAMLLPPRDIVEEVHGLLTRVGIPEKIFERTDRLSGGQLQRVAIARALFQKPRALLADEPVSSVDPARARDTVELLSGISREENLTLVMSLHNLELARAHFPRIVGLRAGRVVFDRGVDDIDAGEFDKLYQLGREEMLVDGA